MLPVGLGGRVVATRRYEGGHDTRSYLEGLVRERCVIRRAIAVREPVSATRGDETAHVEHLGALHCATEVPPDLGYVEVTGG